MKPLVGILLPVISFFGIFLQDDVLEAAKESKKKLDPSEMVSCDEINEDSLCKHLGGYIEKLYCTYTCRRLIDDVTIYAGNYLNGTPCFWPNGKRGICVTLQCEIGLGPEAFEPTNPQ